MADDDHAYHRTATPHDGGAADIPVAERWPSEMRRPEPEPTHAYERACRNTQHAGCTCMHLIDGLWCGRARNDPIHAGRPAEGA